MAFNGGRAMITLKFGGTSMASATRILASADIVMSRAAATGERLAVIVSAVAKVSNALQAAIDNAVTGEGLGLLVVQTLRRVHDDIVSDIKKELPNFDGGSLRRVFDDKFSQLHDLLEAVETFGECPPSIHSRIMGTGELLSAPIMTEVLRAKGAKVVLLDSRDFIYTEGEQIEGVADYTRCCVAAKSFQDGMTHDEDRVLVFPGFVCTWRDTVTHKDHPGLLGRNGSDYSAAIIGSSLNSKRVEFWTDVDGVFTSDPRVVPDALLIDNMSYEEAMELSFFGSKVLHPRTLFPLQQKGIEVWSLNSHNPSAHGTCIKSGNYTSERKSVICGISALKSVALMSVSGSAMRGAVGLAARIFGCVTSAKASMLLITQSSSEYTISFCIKNESVEAVKSAFEKEFALEIKERLLNDIEVKSDCAIISIVGDGMVNARGVASTFMNALSKYEINIKAVAQGSSERCISVVIDNKSADDAVRATHEEFFKKATPLNIFAFGAGTIGGEMLRQINATHKTLLEKGIDTRVLSVTTIDGMLLSEKPLNLDTWDKDIKDTECPVRKAFEAGNVDDIINFVKTHHTQNAVFVDCTASYDLPNRYLDILGAGLSIVTPNKRANSLDMATYKALRAVAKNSGVQFRYETNVGAGLPIIGTLQDLFATGDELTSFEGIMSGSLSHIFGKLDEGVLFSEAVKEARALRYTEPDPRDDLRGTDVARKALIIAREAGFSLELSDIKMANIFPEDFDTSGTVEDFINKLPQVDEYFKNKVEALHNAGKVLRMGAKIEVLDKGKVAVSIGIMEVDKTSPLYSVQGGENAFVFYTKRYTPLPLTVKGYGAGAGVTASGVFADVLKTIKK